MKDNERRMGRIMERLLGRIVYKDYGLHGGKYRGTICKVVPGENYLYVFVKVGHDRICETLSAEACEKLLKGQRAVLDTRHWEALELIGDEKQPSWNWKKR